MITEHFLSADQECVIEFEMPEQASKWTFSGDFLSTAVFKVKNELSDSKSKCGK